MCMWWEGIRTKWLFCVGPLRQPFSFLFIPSSPACLLFITRLTTNCFFTYLVGLVRQTKPPHCEGIISSSHHPFSFRPDFLLITYTYTSNWVTVTAWRTTRDGHCSPCFSLPQSNTKPDVSHIPFLLISHFLVIPSHALLFLPFPSRSFSFPISFLILSHFSFHSHFRLMQQFD